MHTKAFPYIALLGFIWGTNLVISRFGVGQFGGVLFTGLRLAAGSLSFIAVIAFSKRRWPREGRVWKHAMVIGVIGSALPMTAILSSLQFQSAGVTAVLITTTPAFITLAAHFFLPDERLTGVKFMGVMLALTGAMLVVVRGETGLPNVQEASIWGYLLVFSNVLLETATAIYVRRHMRQMDAFGVSSIRISTAALLVLPFGVWFQGDNVTAVTPLGILALCSAGFLAVFFGQFLAFYITQRFGATAFSLTAYIIPVVAAVTGVILLGETITIWMVGGMVLVVLGIMLINR
jgi:drug/metabolite transporter (DMT)-like permease